MVLQETSTPAVQPVPPVSEPLPERTEWISGRPGGATADRVTLDESVSMAFLVVLESMTPAERVALILHDVFGYSFAAASPLPSCAPSKAASRSRAPGSKSPTGRPAT
jgi:RNA polymerase sigma-70 factor (ECF subfamily)